MSTPDLTLASARDRGAFAYLVPLALGALDAAAYSVIAPVAPASAGRRHGGAT